MDPTLLESAPQFLPKLRSPAKPPEATTGRGLPGLDPSHQVSQAANRARLEAVILNSQLGLGPGKQRAKPGFCWELPRRLDPPEASVVEAAGAILVATPSH